MADPKEDDFLDDIEDAASEEAEVAMIDINEEALNDAAFELEKKYPSTTLPLVADLTEKNSYFNWAN